MSTTKLFLACLLFAAAFPAATSPIISVSASLDSNTCSQSAMDGAYCNVSGTASSPGYADVSASVSPTPSLIILNLSANGANATTFASINDMNLIRVNGVTSSGSIQATFYGYDGTIVAIPGAASISPVSVTIGNSSTTFTLHPVSMDNTYSVVAPIDFGTLTPFNIFLTGTASSTVYESMSGNSGFANFFLPASFTVFDANGNVLSNATVEYYAPEPATWFFVGLGLTALCLTRRSRQQF